MADEGCEVYLVGGAVRDSLLGEVPTDLDYAVVCGGVDEVQNYVRSAGGRVVHVDAETGCVKAVLAGVRVDYVMARKEVHKKGQRRPSKVMPGTLQEDLARRDFTVNAMARCQSTGRLIDYFGGEADLHTKTLRCVGSAEDRLSEDPLRLLRAIRFIVTKGMTADSSLESCLRDERLVAGLGTLSPDRIRAELQRCMKADTLSTLRQLAEHPALTAVLLTRVEITCRCLTPPAQNTPDDLPARGISHRPNPSARG